MADLGALTVAYAAYLNAPRSAFVDDDERDLFEQDMAKALAAVEVAWLESNATAPA